MRFHPWNRLVTRFERRFGVCYVAEHAGFLQGTLVLSSPMALLSVSHSCRRRSGMSNPPLTYY
jgi:hypothetical protein